MRALLPCRACGRHVFFDEAECPFCRASTKRNLGAPAIVVCGALLAATAACGGNVTVAPIAGGGAGGAQGQTQAASARNTQGTSGAGGSPGFTLPPFDAGQSPDVATVATSDATDGNPCGTCVNPAQCAPCPSCDSGWECVPIYVYRSPPHRSDWS